MTDVTDLAERLIGDIDALDAERNLAVYERDARLVAREYVALSARLAQAEQERDEWESRLKKAVAAHTETIRKAEARLREYEEALTEFFAEFDGEGGQYAPTDKTEAKMRAALAKDTDG